MHAISPTPLIKVASDAKPYYKLQPTTLNGGEGGVVYFINDMYYWRRIFVRRAAFQSKCLNNFATSCLSAFTLYGHCVSLSIHFKSNVLFTFSEVFIKNRVSLSYIRWFKIGGGKMSILGIFRMT